MNHFRQGLKALLLTLILLSFVCSTGLAVQATGMGVDRDQALNSALQSAIEAELGVAIESSATSENFVLIKKEIITHCRGYVSQYHVVKEEQTADGGVTLTIEAKVDRKRLTDHTQTLDILMKMAGHPKILVLGIDQDFDAVPVNTEIFDRLIKVVSQVFQEKFRFEVLDWQNFQSKHREIEGGLTPELVIRHNDQLKADLMILIGLNLMRSEKSKNSTDAHLIFKGVRISNNHLIGMTDRRVGPFSTKGLNQQQIYKAAVSAAEQEDIFVGAVDLAQVIIENVESELDRGHGFRYLVTFYDFPQMDKVKQNLTQLSGYVRHNIERSSDYELTLAYYSNLKTDALIEQIHKVLETEKFTYKVRTEGRTLKFKWTHPEDF